MNGLLSHRGPDESGEWFDSLGHCGFGHRRLAILDLSSTGRQPMSSADGEVVVAFNGEIYNHNEMRQSLLGRGIVFRGRSDTEVLAEGIRHWGLDETIARCAGMFAIAVWDRGAGTLALGRDRLGEKPLYVTETEGGVAFASELAPLMWLLGGRLDVDSMSLSMLMRYGYVPSDRSIVAGVRKIQAATIERWEIRGAGRLAPAARCQYWSLESLTGRDNATSATVDDLAGVLREVTREQLEADVPVGVFLSGGIDSSVVTMAAQNVSSRPVRTFCIGFADHAYDESSYAAAIAAHLGTSHTLLKIDTMDLSQLVPEVLSLYDEPLADSSQIATVMASRLARGHVKVVLSGDGGDELFGGYNRYYWPGRIARLMGAIPGVGRRALVSGSRQAAEMLQRTVERPGLARLLGSGRPIQDLGGKVAKAVDIMDCSDPVDAYLKLVRRWQNPSDILEGWSGRDLMEERLRELCKEKSLFQGFLQWDIENYLPGDNLAKVDRASMSVGLESRAPLLDHRLVAVARRLVATNTYEKFEREPKWPLKSLLARSVPKKLFDRPKMGFSVPLASWLRRELRDWAGDLIGRKSALADHGIRVGAVEELLSAHLSGRSDHSAKLWPVLVFAHWVADVKQYRRLNGPKWTVRSTSPS